MRKGRRERGKRERERGEAGRERVTKEGGSEGKRE